MLYLANAFSLQMLEGGEANISVEEINTDKVKEIILENNNSITYAIGHRDTAEVLKEILELKAEIFNRINIRMSKGDILIIAQLIGGRLPEGSTKLPDGFVFKFYKMQVM